MSKTVVFGSLLQDIFVTLSPDDVTETEQELIFQIGKKHHIKSIHNAVGGGGANMAVALARLGHNVHLAAAIGKDEVGKLLCSHLERERISIEYVEQQKEKTGFSILFPSRSGNQTIFSYTGANADLTAHIPDIHQFDLLCVAPLHGNAMKNIANVLEKKRENSIVFMNPSVDQIVDKEKTIYRLLEFVDIVQCNHREASLLLTHIVEKRKDQNSLSSRDKEFDLFFKTMHDRGVSIAIVTQGKEGVSVSHNGTIYQLKMPVLTVKNTTGAGDAFGATFLHAYANKKSIPDCLESAAKNVVSVLQSCDAQSGLLQKKELGKKVQ